MKFENGAATTTDVLDAESDVARARLQSSLARYDYYLALVATRTLGRRHPVREVTARP